MLARERAEASHALGEQERRWPRSAATRSRASGRASACRADGRGRRGAGTPRDPAHGLGADLDRGQRELEAQLAELSRRQQEALDAYDARLHADAERLAAASQEQRKAVAQLRGEFERLMTEFVEEGRNEIEAHAAERRSALHEINERLRTRERELRDHIDREEAEARARVGAGHAEAERRQLAQLDKALDRAVSRLRGRRAAVRRADQGVAREVGRAASRELEKSIEQFVRQAESEVSDRIVQLARQTADRMERRLRDVARAAEAQGEVAAERLRHVSERLDAALAGAEHRIAAYEEEVDVRLGPSSATSSGPSRPSSASSERNKLLPAGIVS